MYTHTHTHTDYVAIRVSFILFSYSLVGNDVFSVIYVLHRIHTFEQTYIVYIYRRIFAIKSQFHFLTAKHPGTIRNVVFIFPNSFRTSRVRVYAVLVLTESYPTTIIII